MLRWSLFSCACICSHTYIASAALVVIFTMSCILFSYLFLVLILCGGRFEGISWTSDETFIAYAAEEPELPKPAFNGFGFKKEGSTDKDCGSWKGQGDWEEDWGETYSGKRQPALFVIDTNRYN